MYNHQELNIRYLKQNDSGKYSCQATNRLDSIEAFQQITIKNAKCKFYKILSYLQNNMINEI